MAPLSLHSDFSQANIATPARADPDLELFKDMVERTEHANVRIRKLNLLRSQRRLESQSPAVKIQISLRNMSKKHEVRSLEMSPRIREVTPNMRENGSKSLCVEVRRVRRCHMWVKLQCTWLEP